MLENTITLFHLVNNKYQKKVISNCFYAAENKSTLVNNGMTNNNSLQVIINTKDDISVEIGRDIVVCGNINFEFVNTNERTISESMKTLKTQFQFYTVQSVTKNLFGDLHNIEMICG